MEHLYVITESRREECFQRLTRSSHLGLIKRRDMRRYILNVTLECNIHISLLLLLKVKNAEITSHS